MHDAPPLQTLQRVFGHAAFRGEQAAIVDHVTSGNAALVLMPTGGGKSLCYQIPAILREGCGIVVSPLIALMQDQVEALRQLGVRAEYLNSTLDGETSARVKRELLAGGIDLRSEEHTSELQSLLRISYAVYCWKKKKIT